MTKTNHELTDNMLSAIDPVESPQEKLRLLKAFKGFTESTGGLKSDSNPRQKQPGEHMVLGEIHENVKDSQEQLKLIREHHTNK
ncbi:hypothetical protein [Salinicoccus sp. HZC-1]|uniref:hypothetical protein n=1 Tax=Salinicoccus sp. HZC-1 TaxID=3385497 RepID=UPI00398A5A35